MTSPLRRPALFRTFGAVVAILIVVGGVLALVKITHYLFPQNASLNSGLNPVVISQFGTEIDPAAKLMRFELRPYTGFHAPANVYEENIFKAPRANTPYKFKTNNYGFLTKYDVEPFAAVSLKREPRDRVVLLTGGSAAWGWGATTNDTTSAAGLEVILNHADPEHHWQVVNLGMTAWIAYQEAIALDLYGSGLQPDWVIAFDGRNDILVPTVFGERVPNPFLFGGLKKLSTVFESDGARPGLLSRFSALKYRDMSKKIADVSTPPRQELGAEEIDKAARFYVHSLERIVAEFKASHVLLVTQPSTYYDPSRSEPTYATLTRGYDAFIPRLKELARSTPNVQYVNSLPWFQPALPPYVVDDCHLNDRGQAVVAARLAELILGRGI